MATFGNLKFYCINN